MIDKKSYEAIKKEFGLVSSWAVWKAPGATVKSNTEDMSIFEDPDLLNVLNPKYVFVGLNCSNPKGDPGKPQSWNVWRNFHSGNRTQNDYKIRFALMGTRFWGAYLTDIVKHFAETDSAKVPEYLNAHPEKVEQDKKDFRREISLLGGKPVIIAFGGKAYDILNTYFGNEFGRIYLLKHYSYTIGKEDYRVELLDKLKDI